MDGAAGAAGKGGGGAGQGGSAGQPALGLREAIAKAYCSAARNCCKNNPMPTMYSDPATCAALVGERILPQDVVRAGFFVEDDSKLAACLAAYQSAEVNCDVGPLFACQDVFAGAQLPGEMCDGDCKVVNGAALCAFAVVPTSPGICQEVTHGRLGDACWSTCVTGETCSTSTRDNPLTTLCFESEGLYCSTFGKCEKIIAAGQSCTAGDSCGPHGVCRTTCIALGELGKDCGGGCLNYQVCGSDNKCRYGSFDNPVTCFGPVPGLNP